MKINFIYSKYSDETRTMHTKSEWVNDNRKQPIKKRKLK